MIQRRSLFVYGSLSEGMVHFTKISAFIQHSQQATANGLMYRLKVGYPVFLKNGDDKIHGTLLTFDDSDTLWRCLDELHGYNPLNPERSLYVREAIYVTLDDGVELTCEAYFLNPKKLPKTAELIAGGDWQSSMKANPALTEKLTERQKTYIKRLGACTGREIVPIDLSLYRELMNLEMIVDKGRRLALSPLGQEVFRFLS